MIPITRNTEIDKLGALTEIDILRQEVEKLKNENTRLIEELSVYKKPKKVTTERVRCPCMTAKGTQCRKFCSGEMKTCKVHSKPLKSSKPHKPPRVKKQVCSGINIRGNPCRNKCVDGKSHCERHDPDAPATIKKAKRNKKREVPMHTHDPFETPTVRCLLCETHGDMFDHNTVNSNILETPGTSGYTLRSLMSSRGNTCIVVS